MKEKRKTKKKSVKSSEGPRAREEITQRGMGKTIWCYMCTANECHKKKDRCGVCSDYFCYKCVKKMEGFHLWDVMRICGDCIRYKSITIKSDGMKWKYNDAHREFCKEMDAIETQEEDDERSSKGYS